MMWNERQVAEHLHVNEAWYISIVWSLESFGFLKRDPILNLRDSHAIRRWIANRGGVTQVRIRGQDPA